MDGAVIKTSIPEEPEEAATTILRGGHFHIGDEENVRRDEQRTRMVQCGRPCGG